MSDASCTAEVTAVRFGRTLSGLDAPYGLDPAVVALVLVCVVEIRTAGYAETSLGGIRSLRPDECGAIART